MLVSKLVNFNGKEVLTFGRVVDELNGKYIVEFQHDGIKFFGQWAKNECVSKEDNNVDRSRTSDQSGTDAARINSV